ncbi:hypothetical protein [Kribbella sp. DT2]|uniref:hypothetical protein n=1 Tax=Kribbella sp. DT2 TaxID=3393427 RepID=UPI003CF64CB8
MVPALVARRGRLLIRFGVAAAVWLAATAAVSAASGPVVPQQAANVVVIGVAGLRWSDVQASPELTALVNQADVGSITVRTAGDRTCPVDGWLTINAGTRAWGSPPGPGCGDLPAVTGGRIQNWQSYVDRQAQHHTGAALGRIGSSGAGICGFGPGAALAVAGQDGTVANWAPVFDPAALSHCPAAIIDAGPMPSSSDGRAQAARQVADLAAQARAQHRRVLLVGVSEETAGAHREPQVALQLPPDNQARWLTSGSTRRPGLIQLTDVTATLLRGAPETALPIDGDPVATTGEPHTDASTVIADRLATNERFEHPRPVLAWVAMTLLVAQLAALGWFLVTRSRRSRRTAAFALLSQGGFFIAVNLSTATTWWRWPSPALSLYLVVVGISAAVAALASAVLKKHAYLGVALAAYLLLLVDGVLGTPLQLGSMFADGPVTGGRFYGFGNSTFATLAVGALATAGWAAQRLLDYSRAAAAGAVLAIGAAAIAVDGVPGWGTDFGGIIALTPAVLLLAWHTWRGAISWRPVTVICGTGFVAVAGFAFVDYLQPPERRSHFGTFIARLLNGQVSDVFVRKLQMSAGFFDTPAGWAMLTGVLAAMLACLFPQKVPAATYREFVHDVPMARPTLLAMTSCGIIGMLVNDAGVALAAIMTGFALPLLAAHLIANQHPAGPAQHRHTEPPA